MAHPEQDAGCRFRIYQFLPYLAEAGIDAVVRPFSTPQLFASLRARRAWPSKVMRTVACSIRRLRDLLEVGNFDLIVINREVFPFLAPLWEGAVLRRNPRVVFSFDDAVYAAHPDTSDFQHSFLYRFKYGRGIDSVIARSSHVVAGNRILADYARRLNAAVSVIPTVVDTEYFTYRSTAQRELERAGRPLCIGWMGSASTAPYLKAIEPVLLRLANAYPGKVQYRFVGAPGYRPSLPESVSGPFAISSEVANLHSFDIGLMPMPDTDWTRGKCAFKAIQYMATGAVAVASPVGVTTDLIENGVNGLLASSDDDWYASLARLIENEGLRARLRDAARSTIVNRYSLGEWGPVFARLLSGLTLSKQPERYFKPLNHSSISDIMEHTVQSR